ncbi:MAG TPA: serine/threonine-protein kinase, partial [Planctomycetota bacterium]|nr:serine/threonine-protein kinase [Planctomycetota bacterium]
AVVYEAHDTALKRSVALKMLLPSSKIDPEEARIDEERFIREARLTANLPSHPNIVGVYETGVIDNQRYIAMEYIQGMVMGGWWRKSYASRRLQVRVLRDVALAVHHAHQHGIIHRDLKPANILVDSRNQPHVTDFGLARAQRRNTENSITAADRVVGTPHYMSPEQAEGRRNVDRTTDVWALGVLLYEILAGKVPFRGATSMEVMVKVARDPVPPPSTVKRSGLRAAPDKELEAICLRALARNPKERTPSAKAFAAELDGWLRTRGSGDKLGPYRLFALTGMGAGIAGLLILVLMLFGFFSTEDAPALPPLRSAVAAAPPTAAPPPPRAAPDAETFEGEALAAVSCSHGKTRTERTDGRWSGGAQMLWTGAGPRAQLTLRFHAAAGGMRTVVAALAKGKSYGRFAIEINDVPAETQDVELYHEERRPPEEIVLGRVRVAEGMNTLTFRVAGSHRLASPADDDGSLCQLGLDYLRLK